VKRGKTDAADAEAICEAVTPFEHGVRAGVVGRAASGISAAPYTRPAGQAAHAAGEHGARTARRLPNRYGRGLHNALA
jgi:hypothetical protein